MTVLSGNSISKVKIGTKQLFLRPTLIWDVIKKASVSAFWIPDGRRILIDQELPERKGKASLGGNPTK